MLLRPHLLLLRTRFIVAAGVMIGFVLLTFLFTSSDSLSLAIFWNRACTCPVDPSDLRILFSSSMDFAFVGGAMAFLSGYGPAILASNRFLLTRPESRLQLLLAPFLISAAAIVLLPGLVWLLLLGWLQMVHAPVLGHLVAILELVPAASHLGPHPTFWALVNATHLGRIYLAGISLGLFLYVFFSSSRWFVLSRFRAVKIIGLFGSALLPLSAVFMRFIPRSFVFLPPHEAAFTYLPSTLAIALHFAIAAAWFYGTLWIVRDLEL
jgi:hypothetical protein